MQRCWGNERCPCLHSDPQFTDCEPGETKRLRGWLSIYEGSDLDAELRRIEGTGWRQQPLPGPALKGDRAHAGVPDGRPAGQLGSYLPQKSRLR